MKPLPLHAYEYAEWKKATVNIDYHVEVDAHYYSVPYQLAKVFETYGVDCKHFHAGDGCTPL